ncbi:MAG TPA: hypothetical protein DEA27_02650, partial [Candidatus Moranbacteria bacterium]|nr:hypothetical protein [Candidatus Moranbacteria bacterium]
FTYPRTLNEIARNFFLNYSEFFLQFISRILMTIFIISVLGCLIYVTVSFWSLNMKQNLIAETRGVFSEVILLSKNLMNMQMITKNKEF